MKRKITDYVVYFIFLTLIIILVAQVIGIKTAGPGRNKEVVDPAVGGQAFGLQGKLVIIDPGHGGYDPGSSAGGVMEKDLTIDLSMKLKCIIEENGGKVLMTREEDSFRSPLSRSAMANKYILESELERLRKEVNSIDVSASANWNLENPAASDENKNTFENYQAQIEDILFKINLLNEYTSNPGKVKRQGIFEYSKGGGYPGITGNKELVDIFEITRKGYEKDVIFISIHVNLLDKGKGDQHEASGVQVFYRDNESKDYGINNNYYKNYNKDERERLARSVLDSINENSPFQQKWRDTYRGDLNVLRENNLISTLVEVGFINNSEDRKILIQEKERQKIAESIGKGIINYFNNDNKKPHQ